MKHFRVKGEDTVGKPKKKSIYFNGGLWETIEKLAEDTGFSVSKVVTLLCTYGEEAFIKYYCKKKVTKTKEEQTTEKSIGEQLSDAYMRKVIFDTDSDEGCTKISIGCIIHSS